jgi:hypothetical protein
MQDEEREHEGTVVTPGAGRLPVAPRWAPADGLRPPRPSELVGNAKRIRDEVTPDRSRETLTD